MHTDLFRNSPPVNLPEERCLRRRPKDGLTGHFQRDYSNPLSMPGHFWTWITVTFQWDCRSLERLCKTRRAPCGCYTWFTLIFLEGFIFNHQVFVWIVCFGPTQVIELFTFFRMAKFWFFSKRMLVRNCIFIIHRSAFFVLYPFPVVSNP